MFDVGREEGSFKVGVSAKANTAPAIEVLAVSGKALTVTVCDFALRGSGRKW
ncbi:hypothetical protein GCM10008941_30770 [Rhizomicrobium palustre]